MDGSRVAFAGEDEVAVAADGERDASQKASGQTQNKTGTQALGIQLFDIHTGAVSQRFGDPSDGGRAFVAASSDGRLVLGYTGKEWMYT